ncbi:LEAF RUST 10 DISEASE-RESISTANCE LOCUS RECEPTOR-LIKE PROTEIN KINASE-like 2.1 isoform X2 [Solanum dulcamara]|uniref:LEAF RUST 10 DISEASE-RESISTANCE LOCUS RECEPTOR-LIKE PROTEIN KINASE-like 2.1 isoform X2 n=1 Tax=Solanum dulcamara TaxID=45834 RepID=UPI00248582D8|nr:LEAF RUST 10 DISEASE-RESISTANCE LOCUS RECEPTOR-LIKE PROTEIN KINASE-like 2.1 isoform X2 [Solanum dulcamara]
MDLVSWFLVFILFHQRGFDSVQGQNTPYSNCPQEFQCGSSEILSFPFYKPNQPDCGLCKVDCDTAPHPVIELDGVKYQVVERQNVFVTIKDPILENFLKKKSCRSFDRNLSLPISPIITYRISPFLTLFKCNTSNGFSYDGFQRYNGCESFTLYYNHSSVSSVGTNLPTKCSMIQLPMVSVYESKSNNSDLFDMLAADVSLGWTISNKCNQCYSIGGRCQVDSNNKFLCSADEGKGTSKKHHLRRTWIVVLATVLSCIGILILLFCFRKKIFWQKYLRFWESEAEDHRNIKAFLKNYGPYAPKRYSYSDIRRMTSTFKNKLGQGGYGYVYKGSLHNGSPVAVKVLNGLKGSGEEFINEVASISRTSHVNIVSLVGFCFEGRKRALIYEFMPNGSLEKFIYEERSDRVRQLDWLVLYKTALGIARGLEYLHRGCNTRILHFDIKPHNILLDEDFCPKISDFGLAKLCIKKESIVSMLDARGTIGYIAPEIICRNLGGVSHKSDVYSYGMMVLEMVGGRKNVDERLDRTSEIYFPDWLYQRIELDEELQLNGIMNEEEKECARKMVIASLWCIQTIPSNRPSMTKVVEMLEGNLNSLQIPPTPSLYSSSRTEMDSSEVRLTSSVEN